MPTFKRTYLYNAIGAKPHAVNTNGDYMLRIIGVVGIAYLI